MNKRLPQHKSNRSGMEALQSVMIIALAAVVMLLLSHFMPTIKNTAARFFSTNQTPLPSASTTKSLPTTTVQSPIPYTSGGLERQPTLFENALVLGALFAVIGLSAKEFVVFARLRAELAVVEVLSDNQPRTYTEIISAVSDNHIHKRIRFVRGSITDAIASLVSNGKVEVEKRKYAIAKPILRDSNNRRAEEEAS